MIEIVGDLMYRGQILHVKEMYRGQIAVGKMEITVMDITNADKKHGRFGLMAPRGLQN